MIKELDFFFSFLILLLAVLMQYKKCDLTQIDQSLDLQWTLWTNYRKRKQAQLCALSSAGAHKLFHDEGCYLWSAHLFQSCSAGWELVCVSCFLPHQPWCAPNASQPSLFFVCFVFILFLFFFARACNLIKAWGGMQVRVFIIPSARSNYFRILYHLILFICKKRRQIQWSARAHSVSSKCSLFILYRYYTVQKPHICSWMARFILRMQLVCNILEDEQLL